MIDLQALVDGLGAKWQRERADTQMTLGKMIERLTELPQDIMISGLGELSSYRGYYSDLAFEPIDKPTSVADLLNKCKAAMGQVFQGYKGGDYVMGALTPLWISDYGSSSQIRVMDITDDGTVVTAKQED